MPNISSSSLSRVVPRFFSKDCTAASLAKIDRRCSGVVKELHAKYAAQARSNPDETFAMFVVRSGTVDELKTLLEDSYAPSLDLNRRCGENQRTALSLVTAPQYFAKAWLLVSDLRLDPDQPTGVDDTPPLVDATCHGNLPLVRALLERGVRDAADRNGWRAVDFAVKNGDLKILELLARFGMNGKMTSEPCGVVCSSASRSRQTVATEIAQPAGTKASKRPLCPFTARSIACTVVATMVGNHRLAHAGNGAALRNLGAHLRALFVESTGKAAAGLEDGFSQAAAVLRAQDGERARREDIGFLARLLFAAAAEGAFTESGYLNERTLRLTVKWLVRDASAREEALATLVATSVYPWTLTHAHGADRVETVDPRSGESLSLNVLPQELRVAASVYMGLGLAMELRGVPDDSSPETFDINGHDQHGKTALHEAVLRKDQEAIRILLATPGVRSGHETVGPQGGWTPLQLSATIGPPEIFMLLLSDALATRGLTSGEKNLLHLVASAPEIDLSKLKMLLLSQNGLPVNCQDENGNTALHLSVTQGDELAVQLLVNLGRADCTIRNRDGHTALDLVERASAEGKPFAAILTRFLRPLSVRRSRV